MTSLRPGEDQALIDYAECILFALVMLWTASSTSTETEESPRYEIACVYRDERVHHGRGPK